MPSPPHSRLLVAASDDPYIYGPEWWSYSNGTLSTVIRPLTYDDKMSNEIAGYEREQIRDYLVEFCEIGTIEPYYSPDERHDNPNHNNTDIEIDRHYPDATYLITGYKTLASRDDIVLLVYLFWYMPQHCGEAESLCEHCGEAESLCEQFGQHWTGRGGNANRIKLP